MDTWSCRLLVSRLTSNILGPHPSATIVPLNLFVFGTSIDIDSSASVYFGPQHSALYRYLVHNIFTILHSLVILFTTFYAASLSLSSTTMAVFAPLSGLDSLPSYWSPMVHWIFDSGAPYH